MLKLKRAYEKANRTDGFRVLIDRLWPRGVGKTKIAVKSWMKDLAPSKYNDAQVLKKVIES